jgi:hypothetical protein
VIQGDGFLSDVAEENVFADPAELLEPGEEGVAVHHVDLVHLRVHATHESSDLSQG